MNKYKHKIPRDDLKRFAKEIAKKLVASDYKAGRVKDPTKVDERQQKKVKEFCKQFFDKAYQKHKKHEMEKTARDKGNKASAGGEAASPVGSLERDVVSPGNDHGDDDVKMSDVEDEDVAATPSAPSPSEQNTNGMLKRKRPDEEDNSAVHDEENLEPMGSPSKRMNLEADTPPPPPPPPPAPPAETPPSSTPQDPDPEAQAEAEAEADMDMEMETDIYADSNFKSQSMADVLAQAQEEAENDMDSGGGDGDGGGEPVVKNGIGLDQGLENPLVDEQPQQATARDGEGDR